MKNTIFLLLASALLACSCGHKSNFSIEGHLQANDFDGKTIYMYDVQQQILDSATIHNGAFSFRGWVDDPYFVQLVCQASPNGEQYGIRLIVEPGQIYADLFADSLAGTPLNEEYYQFPNDPKITTFRDQMQECLALYKTAQTKADKDRAEQAYDSIARLWNQALLDKAERTLASHPDDILGAYAFCLIAGQSDPTTGQPSIDVDQLKKRMASLHPIVANFYPTQQILKQLESVDRTAVGQHFVDFEGIDIATNQKSSLAQMINGKIAIVDFWASWCGPCRQEIKDHLIDLYDKYASKGVVVLGVDISDRPEKHLEAVAELGIKYPQLRCDDSRPAEIYGITGIPHIMLISPDGTIIARDLRGPAIEDALKKLL